LKRAGKIAKKEALATDFPESYLKKEIFRRINGKQR
jgi:hypothetical protein